MAACVRTAWLTLAGQTLLLEDPAKGYFCTELNLGYPEVRDVVNNRPDQDGVDDRTQYFGARAVTANISALAGAGARIDDVADSFAPFMLPAARPVLHYVLDRPGTAERVLTLRAAGYSWPIAGDQEREIQLAWVAADPIVRDPTVRTVTAWSGATITPGRNYNLTFNRTYPPGGGGPVNGFLSTPGDVPIRPLLRIYGPISGPRVNFGIWDGATSSQALVWFLASYVVAAGHWVDVDTVRKTAYADGDVTQSVITSLDWSNTTWPVVPPTPGSSTLRLTGTNTTGVTQVQAIFQDGYLS